uniref:Prepilin-type N-terminal cleavage/methylation domain-containing protein n=1 Tax=Desulfovibrio sp. U5L TaxID=596152 RepID=I2Q4Q6_9BACT
MLARQGTRRGGRREMAAVSAGFTFIEVIVVLVLLGLLGIAAFGRLDSGNVRALAQADGLRAAIRYAQSRAMADVYTWGITVSGSQYRLYSNNPAATNAPLPGQGSNSYAMPSSVKFEDDATVTFDWRGQPVTGNITPDNDSAAARTTPLSINIIESSQVVTVTVTPYTGFVP